MKLITLISTLSLLSASVFAETFLSGSTGADGAIDATTFASDDTVELTLPADGVLHFTSVTVPTGKTLKFIPNGKNTPVSLLATGDVLIEGTIDISGQSATNPSLAGGLGGPGGWPGGRCKTTEQLRGLGLGPGAASISPGSVSSGEPAHSTVSSYGDVYGTKLLVPLMGGSGAAGYNSSPHNSAGGGGGGAILIASTTRIDLSGSILAAGGLGIYSNLSAIPTTSSVFNATRGSGGAVRLCAPTVAGAGTVDVNPRGRIRIDAWDRVGVNFSRTGTNSFTAGANLIAIPAASPKLEIIEVAGQAIDPTSSAAVNLLLPEGSSETQTIKVRATNFPATAQVAIVLTPEESSRTTVNLDIPNAGAAGAVGEATITLPTTVLTRIDVWTR